MDEISFLINSPLVCFFLIKNHIYIVKLLHGNPINLQLCKEQAGGYILYSCTTLCVTMVEIGQIARTFLFIQTCRKCKQ